MRDLDGIVDLESLDLDRWISDLTVMRCELADVPDDGHKSDAEAWLELTRESLESLATALNQPVGLALPVRRLAPPRRSPQRRTAAPSSGCVGPTQAAAAALGA